MCGTGEEATGQLQEEKGARGKAEEELATLRKSLQREKKAAAKAAAEAKARAGGYAAEVEAMQGRLDERGKAVEAAKAELAQVRGEAAARRAPAHLLLHTTE